MRLDPEVLGHYARSRERARLDTGVGRLEELRTRELLSRWPPPAPATVLDVGGGAGRYAISRWGSTADGFVRGLLADPEFAELVRDDVRTGVHRNPRRRAGWFTTAYLHRPEELPGEVRAAGLVPDGPVAVEGLAGSAADVDGLLEDEGTRDRVLEALRRTEREPALLGAGSHLLIAGRRP